MKGIDNMKRQEMIKKVIEMAEMDMENIGVSFEDIIAEVNSLSDDELEAYIED